MPIFDLEVLAKALDVLDQVPGRVLLEARAPAENNNTHTNNRWTAQSSWCVVRRTAWTFRLHADPGRSPASDDFALEKNGG